MRTFLTCIFLLLWACGTDEIPTDFRAFPLQQAGVIVKLQQDFVEIAPADYKQLMSHSDWSEAVKQAQHRTIDRFFTKFPEARLLIDTTALERLAFVVPVGFPYLDINADNAELMAKAYLEQEEEEQDDNNTVWRRVTQKEDFAYIRLTIKKESEQSTRFFNHYIISTADHTFGLSFSTPDDVHYQGYVDQTERIAR